MGWSSAAPNIIDILWLFLAFCFFVALCVHNIFGNHTTWRPYVVFQDLIRYGKTKQTLKRDEWLRALDVPKRWFWHFYAVSVCWNGFLLVLYLSFAFQLQSYPSWFRWILEMLTGVSTTRPHVPQVSTLLVQLMLWIHSLRRLQECLCVSVFSDGSMNLAQYVFGLGYYIIMGLTVHCTDHVAEGVGSLGSQIDWFHVAGLGLFIAGSLLQHQSLILLARLRTGKSGSVETMAYRMPEGGWFELVSCPHYFAELLIYISLSLMYGGLSLTWWLVALYVLFCHALEAQLCHDHYVGKYESYPKHRKAFIPFVF